MSMRNWLTLVLVAAFACSGLAANLNKDTKELLFEGNVDFDTAAGEDISFEVGFGYFVADFLELGVAVGVEDNDVATAWFAGGFGEYNFDMGTPLVPFAGLGVSYNSVDIDEFGDEDAVVGQAYAGAKYFLTEDLAVFGDLAYSVATEDIYSTDDDELEDTNWDLNFGLRFYWD